VFLSFFAAPGESVSFRKLLLSGISLPVDAFDRRGHGAFSAQRGSAIVKKSRVCFSAGCEKPSIRQKAGKMACHWALLASNPIERREVLRFNGKLQHRNRRSKYQGSRNFDQQRPLSILIRVSFVAKIFFLTHNTLPPNEPK
jgi:hypothetical protein